jgi:hypothetical protein
MSEEDVTRALAGARRDRTPPPDLEAATLAALRSRGVFAGGKRTKDHGWRVKVVQFAAIAAALLAGVWIGEVRAARPVLHEPRFLLLVYQNPEYQTDPAGDGAREAEYSAWAQGLAREGHMLMGEKVAWGGVEWRPNQSPVERAATPTPDEARGMFVIVAADEQAALAIAKTCPHLKYGGRMILRPMS